MEIQTPELLSAGHFQKIEEALKSRIVGLRVKFIPTKGAPELLVWKTYVPLNHHTFPFELTDFSNPHGDLGGQELKKEIEIVLQELEEQVPKFTPVPIYRTVRKRDEA